MEETEVFTEIFDYSIYFEDMAFQLSRIADRLDQFSVLIEIIFWCVVIFMTVYFMYKFIRSLFRI